MSAYRIQPFLTKAVNLLTVQSVASNNLFDKVAKTNKSTILTTVKPWTHQMYANQLKKLSSNSNVKVVPYFTPLVYHHYQLGKEQFQNKQDPRGISLLVGNNNKQMVAQMNPNKIITMQELCQAFPQKIPLSFRDKATESHIKNLQERIGATLSRKRVLQFEHIILISPYIKMWDESIQVIMDFMPTPFYVPYLKDHQSKDQHYSLTIDDFLSALHHIQKTMKVVVKNHAEPNVIRYKQEQQLDFMLEEIAPQAEKLTVDKNFFNKVPEVIKEEDAEVEITDELDQHL